MSTEAQLKAISNSELASGNQIPALKHRTVNNAIIEEMYDAQSRGDILAGVQTAVSIASGDQVLVIRSGQAYLLDSTEFGFVDALADLTDVSIPAPANDQVLAYNTSTSKWEAKDVNNLANVVSISGNATTNALTKFTGTSSIGDSIISDNGSTVTIAGDLSVNNDLTVGTINSGTSSDFVKGDGSLDSTTYQDTNEKSQANGYAALDSGAKIPLANLPDSILGQVRYQGTWAASTNTPTLANPPASATKGEYYVASDDGTQFGIEFQVGDWIISNGTAWEKVDNTDAVTSVFGRLGNVVANAGDYDAFYVNLDGAETITGEKTFDNDLTVNGSLDVSGNLAVDTDTLFVDSTNNSVLIGTSVDNGTGESLQVTGNALIKKSGDVVINIQSDAADALEFTGSINFFADNGSDFLGFLGYQSVGGSDLKLQNSDGDLHLISFFDDILLQAGSSSSVRVINGDFKVNTDTLFVDVSTNQVGIGTDNPSAKLDVVGDAEINGTLDVTGIGTFDSAVVFNGNQISIGQAPQLNIEKFDGNFRINQSGAGFSGYEIQLARAGETTRVMGDFIVDEGATIDGVLTVGNITTDNILELVSTDSTVRASFTDSLGSSSIQYDGSTDLFTINTGTTINGDLAVDTDTLFVDASANRVGIGTDSPSENLEIKSSIGGSSIKLVDFSNNDTLIKQQNNDNAFTIDRGGTERMRIDSSGNVGIGTDSPTISKLQVFNSDNINGVLVENSSAAFIDTAILANNTSTTNGNLLRLRSLGSNKMVVTGAGNVGIGLDNPTAKLHVDGDAKINGDLTLQKDNPKLLFNDTAGGNQLDFSLFTQGGSYRIFNETENKNAIFFTSTSIVLEEDTTVNGDITASGDAIFGGTISTNNGTNEWELRRAVNEFGLTLFTDRYIWVTIDGVNYALALYSNATFPS